MQHQAFWQRRIEEARRRRSVVGLAEAVGRPYQKALAPTMSLAGVLLVLGLVAGVSGQGRAEPAPADTAGAEPALAAQAAYEPAEWLAPESPIEILLSRPLAAMESLAVFVGRVDLTGLFIRSARTLAYRQPAPPLPAGVSDLVVYRIAEGGAWEEIGRFPLRVLTRHALEVEELEPAVELTASGQVAEGHAPADLGVDRPTYQDLVAHLGVKVAQVRGGWSARSQVNLIGVSHRPQALRFPDLGEDAPRLDLSDYLVEVSGASLQAVVGQFQQGNARHLIQGHAGRGARATVRLGPRLTVAAAGLSGSNVVGWSNPSGLGRPDHRLVTSSVSIEIAPARPGALRLEGTVLDGKRLPTSGFTQGAVTDGEESRGFALEIGAADPTQRLSLGLGFARSRFRNPNDPLLAQGAELVEVRKTTRSARHVDVTLNLLRSVQLGPSLPSSLVLGYRHERVEPLYRSIGADAVQADRLHHTVELNGSLGSVTAVATHVRSEDNLDDLPSILKTRTNVTSLRLGVPVGALVRRPAAAPWLPAVSYGIGSTHQFGVSTPVNGGFRDTHIPDQMSAVHDAALDWQGGRWQVGYAFQRSKQDNRQAERESADFTTLVNTLRISLAPRPSVRVSLDGNLEASESLERSQTTRTSRGAVNLDWRPASRTAVGGFLSASKQRDTPNTFETRSSELRLEVSQGVNVLRSRAAGLPVQVFLRYARHHAFAASSGGSEDDRLTWAILSGLTLRVF